MKQILFIILLAVQILPLSAKEKADTTFVFRFVPDRDILYVPFKENNSELERLCLILEKNAELLQAGKMYISVSSYGTSGSGNKSSRRMAHLRSSRVKSELITRVNLKESYFVTDRQIRKPYHGERNVIVIVIPASADKVEQIAGVKAAETVRAHYREIEQTANRANEEKQALAAKAVREAAEREAAASRAEEERVTALAQRRAEAEHVALEQKRLSAEQARLLAESKAKPSTLSLRTNLLSWAILTPNLGVEWRIHRNISVSVNGSWTSWSWDDSNRRYALWSVSPEINYYLGKNKRPYIGAMYHIGEFNYKLDDEGKQGNRQGGGLTGGYRLPIGKCLLLDFNLGVGYTHDNYDMYKVVDVVRVGAGNETKNYWGINKAGVTLVWKLF